MQLVGNLSCNKWFTIEPINTRLVRVIYSIDVIYRNRFFLFLYISLYALTVTQPEKHPKHNDTPTAIYISHSVLIIHHFTIVKLFVRHWLRSPTLQMQSRNPTIVFKSTKIVSVQSANLRPPSKRRKTNKILLIHKQHIFFKEINGFRSSHHATGLRATTKYSRAFYNIERNNSRTHTLTHTRVGRKKSVKWNRLNILILLTAFCCWCCFYAHSLTT